VARTSPTLTKIQTTLACLGAWFILASLSHGTGGCNRATAGDFPVPAIAWAPERYTCYRTARPLTIDGRLDEPSWFAAAWSGEFVDIRGKPGGEETGNSPQASIDQDQSDPPVAAWTTPTWRTRVKMLWDEAFFYVGAELEEPHLWATYTQRDAIIYHENDFEVFIDPDGDNHEYYELEINALGTVWDLLLIRPYRDGGPAVHAWDIQGLQTAVHLDGSLNDPTDTDGGWTVEIALPWDVLKECAHRPAPPGNGDIWRVNFSRVQWQLDSFGGSYRKRCAPGTNTPMPEDNWVWSPQGLIAMHYPEMWGLVRFQELPVTSVDRRPTDFSLPDSEIRWQLMQIYYRQRQWHAQHGAFTDDLVQLGVPDLKSRPACDLSTTPNLFEARMTSADQVYHIDQQGRLWRTSHP